MHAPGQTVVEAKVRDGKVVELKVTPGSRRKDVIIPKKGMSNTLKTTIRAGNFTSFRNVIVVSGQLNNYMFLKEVLLNTRLL